MCVLFCVDQSFSQLQAVAGISLKKVYQCLQVPPKQKNELSGVKGNHIHFMLQVLWLFVPWRTQPQQNQ